MKPTKTKREYKFINKILCFIGYHSWTWSLREHGMNGIKHSKCKNIFIKLNTTEENLWELKINDDGIGFDIDKILSNGIGLTNMKNRTAIIGAEFNLESNENVGTVIEIKLKKRP